MNIFAKIAGTTIVAGTVLVTAISFTGSEDLQSITDRFQASLQANADFKANETALINKIQVLKDKVAELEQSGATDKALIASLNTQIADLEGQLKDLGEALTAQRDETDKANNEITKANAEITEANAEITKANEQIAALREYVESQEIKQPADISGIIADNEGEAPESES